MNKVWMIACFAGSTVVAAGAWAHGGEHGGAGPRGAYFEHLDTNKDGKVTKSEAQVAGDRLFTEVDANKDGVITAAEAEAGMLAKRQGHFDQRFTEKDTNKDGRLTKEEAKMPDKRFERLDVNHDQVITKEEMRQAFQGKAGKPGRGGQGYFQRMDADNDGKVTRAEAQAAGDRFFAKLDRNNDGEVTRDEMTAGHSGKGGHQGRGGHSGEKGQGQDHKPTKS